MGTADGRHRARSTGKNVWEGGFRIPRYFLQAPPGPLLILVRHGKTLLNEGEPRIRAWANVPLDPKAMTDIRMTANALKKYKPGAIFCSDLMRDTSTANEIAAVLGMSFEPDWNVRTWDVGDLEGELLSDANPTIAALYRKPWETPPGSSESFDGFSKRWIDFLDRKMQLATVPQFRPPIIVTHGKNIALAHSYIDMIPAWEANMPVPAGYAVIYVSQDRSLGIEMTGETENVIEDV